MNISIYENYLFIWETYRKYVTISGIGAPSLGQGVCTNEYFL